MFILREICKRRYCPPSVTLALLLFVYTKLNTVQCIRIIKMPHCTNFQKAENAKNTKLQNANKIKNNVKINKIQKMP